MELPDESAVSERPHRLPTIDEARQGLLDRIERMAPIELPLQEGAGCVIAVDVHSDMDVPEFSGARMDGFAVRASDVHGASEGLPATLTIVGRSLAGRPPEGTVGWGEAVRIASGAVVPGGADCVVPLEDSVVEGETVRILSSPPAGANIRPAGEDLRAGQVVIPAGRKLAAPELGLLAASGRPGALVFPRPRVVVLMTGSGLVDPGRPAALGQVRDATSLTLYAALKEVGAVPYLGGIVPDDVDALKEEMLNQLAPADAFVVCGSAALNIDLLQMAFFRRGEVNLVRAAMEPPTPMAFGSFEGKPFFGVAGEAPDVFAAFEVFLRPALLKMMGRRDLYRPEVQAELTTELAGLGDRARIARVRVWIENGAWKAAGTGERSSTRLAAMAGANGLAIIPAGRARLRAGERARVTVFRPLER